MINNTIKNILKGGKYQNDTYFIRINYIFGLSEK